MHLEVPVPESDPGSPVTPLRNLRFGFGSWRWWDTGTTWRMIEPRKGSFTFALMDKLMRVAEENNLEVVLTLGQPPNWATGGRKGTGSNPGNAYNNLPPLNMADWRNYVKTVALRYKGKIKYYEVWNEPNLKEFFGGSAGQLVDLTREARTVLLAVDPGIKLLGPAVTTHSGYPFLEEFLRLQGGRYIDIISLHYYEHPSPPEAHIAVTRKYRDLMKRYGMGDTPIWNTEAGWRHWHYKGRYYSGDQNNKLVMPDDLASSYIFRLYMTNIVAGIARTYFYGVDSWWNKLRLIDVENNRPNLLTGAGRAMQRTVSWLTGAVVENFTRTTEGIYFVSLKKAGKPCLIAWTDDDAYIPLRLPADMRSGRFTTVLGTVSTPKENYVFDKMPVLIELPERK